MIKINPEKQKKNCNLSQKPMSLINVEVKELVKRLAYIYCFFQISFREIIFLFISKILIIKNKENSLDQLA